MKTECEGKILEEAREYGFCLRTPNKTGNGLLRKITWVPAYAGTTGFSSFPRKRESSLQTVLLVALSLVQRIKVEVGCCSFIAFSPGAFVLPY
jgi:hypothetical protein